MIKAKKSGQVATFSDEAWELLSVGKDGSRDGWFEVKASVPTEVGDKLKATKGADKTDKA